MTRMRFTIFLVTVATIVGVVSVWLARPVRVHLLSTELAAMACDYKPESRMRAEQLIRKLSDDELRSVLKRSVRSADSSCVATLASLVFEMAGREPREPFWNFAMALDLRLHGRLRENASLMAEKFPPDKTWPYLRGVLNDTSRDARERTPIARQAIIAIQDGQHQAGSDIWRPNCDDLPPPEAGSGIVEQQLAVYVAGLAYLAQCDDGTRIRKIDRGVILRAIVEDPSVLGFLY